jgi:hypothetical protein
MLFFRSEDMVRTWCSANGHPVRPRVTIDRLWGLASTWYGARLEADARRPQPDEMRGIFAGLGLTGDFWDPQADTFDRPLETTP